MRELFWIVLWCLAMGTAFSYSHAAENNKLLVYQFSFEVRIVLSDRECPNGQGWQAAAQRIDRIAMPACWTQDPYNAENVKITWPSGDFSVFELKNFQPFIDQ